jgi:hypothetical protein
LDRNTAAQSTGIREALPDTEPSGIREALLDNDAALQALLCANAGEDNDDDDVNDFVAEHANSVGAYNSDTNHVVEQFWPFLCRNSDLEMFGYYEYTGIVGTRKTSPGNTHAGTQTRHKQHIDVNTMTHTRTSTYTVPHMYMQTNTIH